MRYMFRWLWSWRCTCLDWTTIIAAVCSGGGRFWWSRKGWLLLIWGLFFVIVRWYLRRRWRWQRRMLRIMRYFRHVACIFRVDNGWTAHPTNISTYIYFILFFIFFFPLLWRLFGPTIFFWRHTCNFSLTST